MNTPASTDVKESASALSWATRYHRIGATVAIILMTGFTAVLLRVMGRVWWCEGGEAFLWSGNVWSMHNSQHLVDPYSFTHVSHGLIFALLFLAIPSTRRLPFGWRMALGLSIESLWEIIENTPWIINRYREATMALGYNGDSVGNSIGDMGCFLLGFAFATGLRWYWSALLFLGTEAVLLLTIRDNLLLNVLMLLYPIDAIRQWQTAIG